MVKSIGIHPIHPMPSSSDPDSRLSSPDELRRPLRLGFRCPHCRVKLPNSLLVAICPYWRMACRACSQTLTTDPRAALRILFSMCTLTLLPWGVMAWASAWWPGGGWACCIVLWGTLSLTIGLVCARLRCAFRPVPPPA